MLLRYALAALLSVSLATMPAVAARVTIRADGNAICNGVTALDFLSSAAVDDDLVGTIATIACTRAGSGRKARCNVVTRGGRAGLAILECEDGEWDDDELRGRAFNGDDDDNDDNDDNDNNDNDDNDDNDTSVSISSNGDALCNGVSASDFLASSPEVDEYLIGSVNSIECERASSDSTVRCSITTDGGLSGTAVLECEDNGKWDDNALTGAAFAGDNDDILRPTGLHLANGSWACSEETVEDNVSATRAFCAPVQGRENELRCTAHLSDGRRAQFRTQCRKRQGVYAWRTRSFKINPRGLSGLLKEADDSWTCNGAPLADELGEHISVQCSRRNRRELRCKETLSDGDVDNFRARCRSNKGWLLRDRDD